MKTMELKNQDGTAFAVLTYNKETTPSELTEIIYILLDSACEQDGLRLKHDLYEICEEVEAA